MDFFSAIYNGIKSAVNNIADFAISPIVNLKEFFAPMRKRFINNLSEWVENAWKLLKNRYSNWLSGIIYTVGLFLFPYVAIAIFIFDTLFVKSDNGASGKKKMRFLTLIM